MKGFWGLLSKVKKYRKLLVLSIIANIFTALFTIVSIPILIPFFKILFDREQAVLAKPVGFKPIEQIQYFFSQIIIQNERITALLYICIFIVIIFFFKNLFRYLALATMVPIRNGVVRDVRRDLFSRYLSLPLSYYAKAKKGDLIARMSTDVNEIEWSILNVIEVIFKSPLIIIGSIIFMLYINVKLTLFVFVLLLFTGFIIGAISKTLKKESNIAQTRMGKIVSILEESLGGMRIIKGFNAQGYLESQFAHENEAYKSALSKLLWRRDLSSPMSEFLGISVVALLLYYGSLQVFQGQLTPETFFAFIMAFYTVIEPAKSFSSAYYNIQKGTASVNRINKILKEADSINTSSNPQQISSLESDIIIKNLKFKYIEDVKLPVIDNLNLTIPKGKITALVGASGAGKTSLVDLLLRFYDYDNGNIIVNGIDIQSYDITQYRSLFGVVSQEPVLFHDTIANNIRFGADNTSMNDIINAAKTANAHEFITALPDGYDSIVGDRGQTLSGGQRQRLTIARAILRNPPILILDEATSSLDSESEKAVQLGLNRALANRTSIIIAHRLSTIKNADNIVVLNQGKLSEQGTHLILKDNNGIYAKLLKLQNE